MYSAYSAILRGRYWGGIPISLLALGAFSFFLGFSIYLFFAADAASRKALAFFAISAMTPLAVSMAMFYISLTKVGSLCKTCVGIYLSSALLAAAALLAYRSLQNPMVARPAGKWGPAFLWLFALAVSTLLPSWAYAGAVPDQRPYLRSCGKLEKPAEAHNALMRMRTTLSVRSAILFEDPLCPTCRAFHQRMIAEGIFDRLDVQLALFPLDSDCNWMLTSALHPGACLVSKAVICGIDQARHVLEWAYDQQDELVKAAKGGDAQLRAMISRRWGAQMLSCIDSAPTKLKLNHQLHFAADNSIPVSTPQMYLGDLKVCDEDTDLGLRYTLGELAPEVVP
jgi:vitamin K epoxide reductase family protein